MIATTGPTRGLCQSKMTVRACCFPVREVSALAAWTDSFCSDVDSQPARQPQSLGAVALHVASQI
eukprot:1148295-Rhodomonas_salina.1